MTDLSRERIAELRRFVEVGLDVAASQGMCVTADKWRDILAALDAYEAQRPRPASEAPQHPNSVIVWDSFRGEYFPERATYRQGEWYCEETGGEKEYRRDAPAYWSECPPAPERDDG